ncbi:MAG: hypothetical protein HZB70_03430 [Candidatus Berkelbacteria bacterium]|nr:MAG: hypothetical protein HZB70_03430 [Candidatus Berkelbacteria bacterium]QQG51646.1 MAG: hypothetical protein HY845_03760 [Candidatus Berkelbacteria bacterium]
MGSKSPAPTNVLLRFTNGSSMTLEQMCPALYDTLRRNPGWSRENQAKAVRLSGCANKQKLLKELANTRIIKCQTR